MRQVSVTVPLRREFQGVAVRRAVLVEGPAGWGEMSPLPGYSCQPMAARRSALEAACTGWPQPVRTSVAVNATIPAAPPEEAAVLARRAAEGGYTTFKVKVGTGDDEGRLKAVRAAVGTRARLRIDANGAWDLEDAVRRLGRLARFDLELAEQPVEALDDLARLRRRVRVPLAADECVRGLEDARRLARLAAADALVLKVQPLGGVVAALEVAEAAGVAALASSMVETSVGLAAGLALACCLPELPFACGLGTADLLAGDVVRQPLSPLRGVLEARAVIPDPALLARYGESS